jgi:hypothetical protein
MSPTEFEHFVRQLFEASGEGWTSRTRRTLGLVCVAGGAQHVEGLTTGHDGVSVFMAATRGGRHLAGKRIR